MGESEIPFPFLNGQVVEVKNSEGQPTFYRVAGQGKLSVKSLDYTIAAGKKNTDNTFTVGGADAFKTSSSTMKVWVSWIDNINLKVVWTVGDRTINQLDGVASGLTYDTSPIGSYAMPLVSINNPTPSVSFDLINASSTNPVRGTFKVIIAEYRVSKLTEPVETYTSLDYPSGGG